MTSRSGLRRVIGLLIEEGDEEVGGEAIGEAHLGEGFHDASTVLFGLLPRLEVLAHDCAEPLCREVLRPLRGT